MLNTKQDQNTNDQKTKRRYDLEERTMLFARETNAFVRRLPKDVTVSENGRQLVRSAGSVAANYIEANEALSKKDFIMRIKICRKEAKESRLWLNLLQPPIQEMTYKDRLLDEATQLMKIFGAILTKTGNTKF
ncbi:four helix bundle protein [candidate division WOR-1 bacterium RIFCSPHIGHO2_01_FULL_53_15]|uniref:Four helix bundle protein n=1 Tax=candidate division WOR-1 bacterium RIFCSPHIGHO2_01_FULL_53_15 TaxID=1802564 RepID=A0A1F4Q0C0_UNCSA|nr:MAG: four helix bundle protein [candidate division WOR-1 bacterium RIFCSPHIGHO2_01_FULL_53_15]OGC12948.1 MAG: four helix bundle protein [candidate division WOR-1 bacterium RIFCSPHIGHO2_02_FULL_53_26]